MMAEGQRALRWGLNSEAGEGLMRDASVSPPRGSAAVSREEDGSWRIERESTVAIRWILTLCREVLFSLWETQAAPPHALSTRIFPGNLQFSGAAYEA